MMQNIKTLKVLSVFTVLALTLVGCTGTSDDSSNGDVADVRPEIVNENLTEHVGEGYNFYFPNYYEVYENPEQQISYMSKDKNELGGAANVGAQVMPLEEAMKTLTLEQACDSMGNGMVSVLGEGVVPEVKELRYDDVVGCEIDMDVTIQAVNMSLATKMLWQEDGDMIYSVASAYFDNTPESEVQDLNDAVEKFDIIK